jgi:hypothetical protein
LELIKRLKIKTRLLIILTITIILLTFAGCGISQEEYNKALSDKQIAENLITSQNATIQELTEQLNNVKPPSYFENRTAIENWLKTVKKLGVSKDVEEWMQFALYYQQDALNKGYIISVSYSLGEDSASVTCDIVPHDGWIYYFDPDDCELIDTYMRIDMIEPEELENIYSLTY